MRGEGAAQGRRGPNGGCRTWLGVCVAGLIAAWPVLPAHAQWRWLIGQSAPLNGAQAAYGKEARDGARAAVAAINAAGGVAGRPLELVTLDDAQDPARAAFNAKALIQDFRVLALFGMASTMSALQALPVAEAAGVPLFAPLSGAVALRGDSPVLFTTRASVADEVQTTIDFWIALGMKRVAVLHADDPEGRDVLKVATDVLARQRITPQAVPVRRNAPLTNDDMQRLLAMRPEVLLNAAPAVQAAQVQTQLRRQGFVVPLTSLSQVGAEAWIAAAAAAAAGTSMTMVVPAPGRLQVGAVAWCDRALHQAGSTAPMTTTQLESCLALRVLAEGIRRTPRPVTPQRLRDALESLGTVDLGGFTVTLGPGAHHGSRFVELGMISRDGRLTHQ